MDDLTPSERAYADLAADGVDEVTLAAELRVVPIHMSDGRVVIRMQIDGQPTDLTITVLKRVPNLRGAFAVVLGSMAGSMLESSFRTRESDLTPFFDFLVEKKLENIKPRHITNALLDDFRDWLNDYEKREITPNKKRTASVFRISGGGKLKVGTKRRSMDQVLAILRPLRVDRDWWLEIGPDVDLIRAGDWTGEDRTPVEILNRPTLKLLVRLCREEVTETTARLRDAWAVIDGREPERPMSARDRELILEVSALHKHFDGRAPKQQALAKSLGEDDRSSFPILRRLKSKQYNAALCSIYPSGRLLMPFLLLFAIFYRYNRSVVTTMKASHFSEQPSVNGGLRLRGMPFKNRARRTQQASWPINADPHNPAQMLETLERWTSLVREKADDDHANHVFLERGRKSKTRSLAETYAFDISFLRFLEDHEKELKRRFVFRALRPSVINLVHHLFDGDLLATAEAGQHGVRTMVDHYLFDGARKANEEALVAAMHGREAWRESGGRVDMREDKRRGDISAATPGFICKDRYASKMPGQRPGRLCTAYGMCPNCTLGKTDVSSPEAYALVFKLEEAIARSRTRMPAASWIGRWAAILDRVNLVTLRSFLDGVAERADLDIPDLPTVE